MWNERKWKNMTKISVSRKEAHKNGLGLQAQTLVTALSQLAKQSLGRLSVDTWKPHELIIILFLSLPKKTSWQPVREFNTGRTIFYSSTNCFLSCVVQVTKMSSKMFLSTCIFCGEFKVNNGNENVVIEISTCLIIICGTFFCS